MFTKDNIEKEIHMYEKFTKCKLPDRIDIMYENISSNAIVYKNEIVNGNNVIHLSNLNNKYFEEYQKAILWHEFTHISDIINFSKTMNEKQISGVISTYSEAHATEIELRCLLKLKMSKTYKQPHGSNGEIVSFENEMKSIGAITAQMLNNAYTGYSSFIKTGFPEDFRKFLNNYCYFCGHLNMMNSIEANMLINGILNYYNKNDRNTLKDLYNAIHTKNVFKCNDLYWDMYNMAVIYSENVNK